MIISSVYGGDLVTDDDSDVYWFFFSHNMILFLPLILMIRRQKNSERLLICAAISLLIDDLFIAYQICEGITAPITFLNDSPFQNSILYMILLPTILIFTGCGDEKVEQPPPPMVKTISANKAGKIVSDTYPGVVKGRYESNLAFQTSGRILSREVQKGSLVNAGEILMTIDSRDAVQQFNAGEAQVAQAQSQLNLAKSNLDRYAELYKENAIAAATLDQYQTAYDNALATYNAAVAQAEQTKNNLNYTNLPANADGVISQVNAEVGQVGSMWRYGVWRALAT